MRLRASLMVAAALVLGGAWASLSAKQVVPMYGGVIIEGYDYQADIGPKGTIAFDESAGKFVGSYMA